METVLQETCDKFNNIDIKAELDSKHGHSQEADEESDTKGT